MAGYLDEGVGEALVEADPLGGVDDADLVQEVAELHHLHMRSTQQKDPPKLTFFSWSSGSLVPPVSSWSRFLD